MPRKDQELNFADELLEELLSDCQSPEEILGEPELLKQLIRRLVGRVFAGDLNHLKPSAALGRSLPPDSCNNYSSKTLQSEQGELELAIFRIGTSLAEGQSPRHLQTRVGAETPTMAERSK